MLFVNIDGLSGAPIFFANGLALSGYPLNFIELSLFGNRIELKWLNRPTQFF
jgi:hypothetical protein